MKSCCQKKPEQIRTPLGKAKGLGSNKSGFAHWWAQRVTAIALVPLSVWLLLHIKYLFASSHVIATSWLAQPMNAVGVLLFLGLSFYHALLGLEVVVEDYAPCKASKTIGLLFIRFVFVLLGAMSIYAVLQINFGVDMTPFAEGEMYNLPLDMKE